MIVIKESKIVYKNPIPGQPTRAKEEHYYARRIIAGVNGEDRFFNFSKEEIPFLATEEEMIIAIERVLEEEEQSK